MQLGVLCTTDDKVLPLFNLFLVPFFTSVSPGILYQLCVGFVSFLSLFPSLLIGHLYSLGCLDASSRDTNSTGKTIVCS